MRRFGMVLVTALIIAAMMAAASMPAFAAKKHKGPRTAQAAVTKWVW